MRRVGNLPTIPHHNRTHGGQIAHPTLQTCLPTRGHAIPARPDPTAYPDGSTNAATPRPASRARASPGWPNNTKHARRNPPHPEWHGPKTGVATHPSRVCAPCSNCALRLTNRPTETCLDLAPAAGKVRIARRQGPDRVQMVRQNNDGIRLKRLFAMGGRIDGAQRIYVRDQQVATTMRELDGKEIGRARYAQSAVMAHALNIPSHG